MTDTDEDLAPSLANQYVEKQDTIKAIEADCVVIKDRLSQLLPYTLDGPKTWTFPDATGTVILDAGTQTITGAKTMNALTLGGNLACGGFNLANVGQITGGAIVVDGLSAAQFDNARTKIYQAAAGRISFSTQGAASDVVVRFDILGGDVAIGLAGILVNEPLQLSEVSAAPAAAQSDAQS